MSTEPATPLETASVEVLRAMYSDSTLRRGYSYKLNPILFPNPTHAQAFRVLAELKDINTIDSTVLAATAQKLGIPQNDFNFLTAVLPKSADIVQSYSQIVIEEGSRLATVTQLEKFLNLAKQSSASAEQISLEARLGLLKIEQATAPLNKHRTPTPLLVQGALKYIEKRASGKKTDFSGVPSGFMDLDYITDGFQPGISLIGGRPDVEPTDFAISVVSNLLNRSYERKIAYVTASLSAHEIMLRLLSNNARVILKHLRDGPVPKNDEKFSMLLQAGERVNGSNLAVYDKLDTAAAVYKRMAFEFENNNLGIIFIDKFQRYIHPMPGTAQDLERRERALDAEIQFTQIAKDFNIPVVIVSETSGASERTLKGRVPRIADLRTWGALEYDTTPTILLDRKFYSDEKFQVSADTCTAYVYNGSHVDSAEFKLTYLPELHRFENFTP